MEGFVQMSLKTYDSLKSNVEYLKGALKKEQESHNEDVAQAIKEKNELVEKETAKTPDIEGDGYCKGELVYDTWICPRCGTRYEIDYDEYEYCPKCGQHIDLDSLEQECEDTEDEE